jgi:hypothetical protein
MIPRPQAFEKIGFFHSGDTDRSDPVKSLARGLDKAASTGQDIRNSLIVLPEALNMLNDYMTRGDPDPSVVGMLKEISMSRRVVFVTGLIIESKKGQRYSCACLIDGDICKILSCKTDEDGSHNYQPYPGVFDQPTLHRGFCIAALVCHDASERTPDGRCRTWRHGVLACQIEERRHGAPAVLCVPGRMNALSSEAVAEHWCCYLKNCAVVVANGTPRQPSIIRFGGQLVCPEKHENTVCLYSLADIKATR